MLFEMNKFRYITKPNPFFIHKICPESAYIPQMVKIDPEP